MGRNELQQGLTYPFFERRFRSARELGIARKNLAKFTIVAGFLM
jgi:hypothetical protein